MKQFRPILAALAFAAAGMTTTGATAADSISLHLEVEAGGLSVMKVKLGFDYTGSGFTTSAGIRSQGLASLWGEYKMDAEGSGVIAGGMVQPRSYSYRRERDGKEKSRRMTWTEDGSLVQHQPASKDSAVQAGVDASVKAGTLDPLAGLMRIGLNSGDSPCGKTYRVFDGRDVFDIVLGPRELTELRNKHDTAYRGPAHFCSFKWVAIAGRWFSKSDSDELVDNYDAWFAPFAISGQEVWLPMLITGKLKGLRFKAYADKVVINGDKYKSP